LSSKQNIYICSNTGCNSSGSDQVFSRLNKLIHDTPGLAECWEVKRGGCHGFCEAGPTMIVGDNRTFYIRLTEDKVDEIVQEHLMNNNVVEKYLFFCTRTKSRIENFDDLPILENQKRKILHTSPFTDPVSLSEYQQHGGFTALQNVLDTLEPLDVCELIIKSKLRGRGGGGFLTGEKWKKQAYQISQPKYVICNGDEGDPGTFMDRSLLEGDPFLILEGMLIAGYATMSNIGIVYVRDEYNLAVERIENAIRQLYDNGFLGSSVMERPFLFDIKVEYGPGAYICGEETALLSSIESRRGSPGVRPPFPVEKGLFDSPTLMNNVETFANIPVIITEGVENYLSIGTGDSTGTKLLTLTGNVKNSGIVEVSFGTSFDTIINRIGGGMSKMSNLKAIQVGGASGGILPASLMNEEVSYDNLTRLEVSLGAGGIVVLDDNSCMVDLARFYMEFAQNESCGVCVPCREGTQRMLRILDRIIGGKGQMEDLEKMKTISEVMYTTSLCGLGREAINMIKCLLHYFEEELHEHILEKKCRAGVCPNLVRYSIRRDKCIGCGACTFACSVDAISGEKGQYHNIDNELCIRCGQCFKYCPQDAITRS
jgi:NADP-reducing hydrogenase subunit HndC